MKINNKKHSLAIVLIAMISMLAIVSSASAAFYSPIYPIKTQPTIAPLSASFTWSYPYPASFSTHALTNYPIQFTDTSTPAYKIKKWNWQFKVTNSVGWDGGTFTYNEQNPVFNYYDGNHDFTPHTVKITLTVTDSDEKSASVSHSLYFY